jgi:hypothetical protein
MLSGTQCFEEEISVKDAGVDVLFSSTCSFVEAVWFLWCIVLLVLLYFWSGLLVSCKLYSLSFCLKKYVGRYL